MLDILINAIPKPAMPGSAQLRKLARGSLECWSKSIRSVRLTVKPSTSLESARKSEYLCCLNLDLVARAPVRVVATGPGPSAAVTLVLRRAQALLQARIGRAKAVGIRGRRHSGLLAEKFEDGLAAA